MHTYTYTCICTFAHIYIHAYIHTYRNNTGRYKKQLLPVSS